MKKITSYDTIDQREASIDFKWPMIKCHFFTIMYYKLFFLFDITDSSVFTSNIKFLLKPLRNEKKTLINRIERMEIIL